MRISAKSEIDVLPISFLRDIEECKIVTFENVLKQLKLNIQLRFPCPSSGVDLRLARSHIDARSMTLNEQFLKSVMGRCRLYITVGIFLFPDDLIRRRKINNYFVSGRFPEIQQIANEFVEQETQIVRSFHATSRGGEGQDDSNRPISLLDVFKVVSLTDYPFLWDIVLKTLAVMPTSVSCEQSFSRIKNKLHENMNKETAFHFMAVTCKNPICFFME